MGNACCSHMSAISKGDRGGNCQPLFHYHVPMVIACLAVNAFLSRLSDFETSGRGHNQCS